MLLLLVDLGRAFGRLSCRKLVQRPSKCRAATHRRSGPVDPVRRVHSREQDLVDPIEHTGVGTGS
jgi:hypothetical protein